jgi:hypothetical protein
MQSAFISRRPLKQELLFVLLLQDNGENERAPDVAAMIINNFMRLNFLFVALVF